MIDSTAVAKKLGIGKSAVRGLVRRGLLKDYGVTKNGNSHHEFKFKVGEVNEFKRIYKPRMRFPNSVLPTKAEIVIPKQEPVKTTGIITRLERIESKLDKLIQMWS